SVIAGAPEASSVHEICARQRVTCLELTILQATSLVLDATDPRPLPGHTTVYAAGAMVTSALRRRFESRFGVPLFVHYGAREIVHRARRHPGGRGRAARIGERRG